MIAVGVNGNEIAAIGFSGHIRSVAFLDDNFKTLHPGIIWSDTRSSELVRDLPAEVASDIRAITGNQAATNFALPNMLWLKQRYPDLFDRTRYFATPKDYVIQRFTGEWVGDASGQAGVPDAGCLQERLVRSSAGTLRHLENKPAADP